MQPSQIGGVERLVSEIIERLKTSNDVTVLCGGKEKHVYFRNGIQINVVPARAGSYSFAPQALSVLESARPDVIYAHDYSSFMPYIAARYKTRYPKTRFVFHTHFHPRGSNLLARLLRVPYDPTIGKIILNKADAIICNANIEKMFLKRLGVKKSMHVVYNGVDVDAIEKAKPYVLREKVLLYVGRLAQYKNVHLTIKALRILPPDFHFYVVGKGPYFLNLRKLAYSLNVHNRVHFLGFITNEELRSWYQTASSLIHLSEFESFGMTCIEALAARTPVVANDDDYGLSETISLFPASILRYSKKKKSHDNLSDLIESAVKLKPVNVDLSAFTWDSIANQIQTILLQ